jgi:hypothetical protein
VEGQRKATNPSGHWPLAQEYKENSTTILGDNLFVSFSIIAACGKLFTN